MFYERKGDWPERLAGRARFTMVWVWSEGSWKLSRVLSTRHGPANNKPGRPPEIAEP